MEVYFKSNLGMIFFVQHKYLSCVVDKTIGIVHTTSTDCNTIYRIILLLKLFTTSWCKLLEADPSREVCTYAIWVKAFFPNTHPDKLICVCCCSTWKCLILSGMQLGDKKDNISTHHHITKMHHHNASPCSNEKVNLFMPNKTLFKAFLLQITRASYISQALTPPAQKFLNFFI